MKTTLCEHCYVATSTDQILEDLKTMRLRWLPVPDVRGHPAIQDHRKDDQCCLMMGTKLIDDDTESGVDTWFLIYELLSSGVLVEESYDTDSGTGTIYKLKSD